MAVIKHELRAFLINVLYTYLRRSDFQPDQLERALSGSDQPR